MGEDKKIISHIEFPNTARDCERESYHDNVKADFEIRQILKAGEMGNIKWFQIVKEGNVIAEIKESVCHVFYKQEEK